MRAPSMIDACYSECMEPGRCNLMTTLEMVFNQKVTIHNYLCLQLPM